MTTHQLVIRLDTTAFDRMEQGVLAQAFALEQEIKQVENDTKQLLARTEQSRVNRALTLDTVNSAIGRSVSVIRNLLVLTGTELDRELSLMIDVALVALSITTAANVLMATTGAGFIAGAINLGLQGVQLANLLAAINNAQDARIDINAQTSAGLSFVTMGLSFA